MHATDALWAGLCNGVDGVHADCEFVDLGVDMAPVRVLVRGASASFLRCTFSDNSVPSTQVGVITTSVHAVAVRLEGCMFGGSGGGAFGGGGGVPRSLVDANGSALIFSDPELDVWLTDEAAAVAGAALGSGNGTRRSTRPLADIPRNVTFLDASDAWLKSVQEVNPATPAMPAALCPLPSAHLSHHSYCVL